MVWILEQYIKKCWVNHVNEKICQLEVAAGRHFEFDQVEIFHGISLPETAHFVQ